SALSAHTRASWKRVSKENDSGTRLKLPIARPTRPASSASLTPILLGRILSSVLGARARTRAMRAGITTVPTYSPQAIVKRRSVRSAQIRSVRFRRRARSAGSRDAALLDQCIASRSGLSAAPGLFREFHGGGIHDKIRLGCASAQI